LDELSEAEFISKVNSALPDGFRFRSLKRLEPGSQSLIKVVNRAEYRVPLEAPEIRASIERLAGLRSGVCSEAGVWRSPPLWRAGGGGGALVQVPGGLGGEFL